MEYIRIHEIENLELLEKLIEDGFDLNEYDSYGLTPLHYCDNPSVVEFLIMNGADPMKKSNDGKELYPIDLCWKREVKEILLQYSSSSSE